MSTVLMHIGNIVLSLLISRKIINGKIHDICRYIAEKKYVKDKNKKLSFPEDVKVLYFALKLSSILNLVCMLLFLIIGLHFLSGWFKIMFILISTEQFYNSLDDFSKLVGIFLKLNKN